MNKKSRTSGLSLVELIVAIGLFVFMFSTVLVIVKGLFRSAKAEQVEEAAMKKLDNTAAALRYEAAAKFYSMDETDADRTGLRDRHIKILSTIYPIDPDNRTRKVVLKAIYNVSPTNSVTKTTSFTLANTIANIAGAAVTGTVLDFNTNAPVPDVYITMAGENLPQITGVTDVNGVFLMYGADIGNPASTVSYTGLGPSFNTYFKPDPPHMVHFENAFNLTSGELRTLPTVFCVPPGNATIHVRNAADTNPASNLIDDIKVVFYPQPGQVPPPYTLSTQSSWGITDPSGGVTITNLIPGNYYVSVVGVGTSGTLNNYSSADLMNTASDPSARTPFCTVVSNTTQDCGDRYTLKKGSIQGTVYEVTYATPSYSYGSAITAGTSMQFGINDFITGKFNDTTYAVLDTFNFANALVAPMTQYRYPEDDSDASGHISLDYTAPLIINSSHTPVALVQNQGEWMSFRLGSWTQQLGYYSTPAPYTPVVVQFDSGSNPHFLFWRNWFWTQMTAPAGTSTTMFDLKMFSDHLTNPLNTSYQWGTLKADNTVLCAASGTIVGSFPAGTTGWANHYVSTRWGANTGANSGQGGLGVMSVTGVTRYYVNSGLNVQTTFSNPSVGDKQSFTFRQNGLNRLFPNLATDTQSFNFYADRSTYTLNSNTWFYLHARKWTKDAIGNVVLDLTDTAPTLTLEFRYNSGTTLENPPMTGMAIVSSSFTFQRTAKSVDTWTAIFAPVTLTGGQIYTYSDTNAVFTGNYLWYYIRVATDTAGVLDGVVNTSYPNGVPFQFYPAIPGYAKVYPGYPIGVAERILVNFSGTVTDNLGVPLLGATVQLCGHGIPFCLNSNPTPASGSYSFDNIMVALWPSTYNAWLQASMPGYQTSATQNKIIAKPPANPVISNFALTPNGGGGTGSSSGGGGY